MSKVFPKYWGSWEGKIITLLIMSDETGVSWEDLVKQTGLTGFQLKSALATLFDSHVITKEETEANYHLTDEKLGSEYKLCIFNSNVGTNEKEFSSLKENEFEEVKNLERKMSQKDNGLSSSSNQNQWIKQWVNARDLNFSLENQHFFLAGLDLDDFTKQVILDAKVEILIANPCLENCYLTIALEHIARKGIKVIVVTRPPLFGEASFDAKQDCHAVLRSSGVSIRYLSQVHSKVLSIDNKVAIISSTNFCSGYSGGTSLEAGMISIDEKVIEEIEKYVSTLFEKTESEK